MNLSLSPCVFFHPCRAVPTFTVLQPHTVCENCSLLLRSCCQHVSKSSAPLSCAPLCGLCQSVCAAVMLPTCIVLESRVVSGLDATVLVWIWGWMLTAQGPWRGDSEWFPVIYSTITGDRQSTRVWMVQYVTAQIWLNKTLQSKNKVSVCDF